MATRVYNRDGGSYSPRAFSAFEGSVYGNCVAATNDLKVTVGDQLSVNVAPGEALIDTGDGYPYRVGSDATVNVMLAPASSANNRRDTVVVYVDNSVRATDRVLDNVDTGMLAFKAVPGTPSASPQPPSASMIQSAIGAGNPYMELATVDVAKAASVATNIVDKRVRALPVVDSTISSTSTNAVQNKVVKGYVDNADKELRGHYIALKEQEGTTPDPWQYFAFKGCEWSFPAEPGKLYEIRAELRLFNILSPEGRENRIQINPASTTSLVVNCEDISSSPGNQYRRRISSAIIRANYDHVDGNIIGVSGYPNGTRYNIGLGSYIIIREIG